jgi:hypothetical protein
MEKWYEIMLRFNLTSDINDVVRMLNEQHGGSFMIWNLSEKAYNYELFDNQVRKVIAYQR